MRLIEITLTGSRQQVSTGKIYSPYVIFQNNDATNGAVVGDNTVTTTRGINLVKAGGNLVVQRSDNRILLDSYYVIGTAASKVEILYE